MYISKPDHVVVGFECSYHSGSNVDDELKKMGFAVYQVRSGDDWLQHHEEGGRGEGGTAGSVVLSRENHKAHLWM